MTFRLIAETVSGLLKLVQIDKIGSVDHLETDD